uniref:Protein SDA1 n=1 Tax=Panagrellus redivivus TaxID=6233 RepID=A0A7E4UXG3_PANRE
MAVTANVQGRYASLDSNLGLLQEMVRKDPESYREEFEERLFRFQQRMHLFDFNTHFHRSDVHALLELVTFVSGVADKYPEHGKTFAKQISDVLNASGPGLDPEVRLAFAKAIVTLRNKNILTDLEVFEQFFELVKCEDKHLRKFILGALVSFIKQSSQSGGRSHNKKAISKMQNYTISKLKDSRSVVCRIAQLVLIDAFRKGFWKEAKIVNALAECIFHKSSKIQAIAMRFFLGSLKDEEGESSDDDDSDADNKKEDSKTIKEVMTAFKFVKKTKKRQKNFAKTKKALTKEQKEKKESRSKYCNLQAIQMLFDPQSLIDRLFALLEGKKNEKFVIRLQQIALCARVIGIHHLQTLGFYSYLHRYIQPKQREVTRILLYAAQACHELVPPDVVESLVRVIANNFVTDRNTPEGMTVGINAIREIFTNCPFAATEELLRELCEYKSYKNKNVSMAARGLITLFRQVNPKLLAKKDRGRPTEATEDTIAHGALNFGSSNTVSFIAGAEILPEEENSQDEDADLDDSDSEDGWVDVDSDGDGNDADETVENDEEGAEDSDDEQDAEDDDEEGAEDDDEEGWVTDSDGEEGAEDEEGWETASDDDEEEGEKEETAEEKPVKEKPLTRGQYKTLRAKSRVVAKESQIEKAKAVSEARILTDADFKKIRTHQLKKKVGATDKDNRKRTNDDRAVDEEVAEKRARRELGGDGLPRLNDIVYFHKKLQRQSKEERLAASAEGREGREEFGRPKKKGAHVGRTNREMAKKKDFRMVQQKIRGRNRQRSFRDRQATLRKYLIRQAGGKTAQ